MNATERNVSNRVRIEIWDRVMKCAMTATGADLWDQVYDRTRGLPGGSQIGFDMRDGIRLHRGGL